jgi:hypothetical protein
VTGLNHANKIRRTIGQQRQQILQRFVAVEPKRLMFDRRFRRRRILGRGDRG